MNTTNVKITAATIVVILLSLLLTACGPGQITSSITLVVDSAEIALPIIAAANPSLDPKILTAAETYLQAVDTAVTESEPILADATMPASVKTAKITALFAGLVSANLPPGTPQAIAVAVQAVANNVATFLTNFASNGKPKVVGPNVKIVLSAGDQKKLATVAAKAKSNLAKLAAMKAAKK